jgi:LmbE family N-acetylglucosaminyl deacetylase
MTMPMVGPGARSGGSSLGSGLGPGLGSGSGVGVGGRPRSGLPQARSVLAVAGRPGDEAYYLGALLDAFRASGTTVSALVFTGGTAAPHDGSLGAAASARSIEFEVASFVLRVTHRLMIDYPDGGLGQVPAVELAGQVVEMIRRTSADLLLTADAGVADPSVVEAACTAGRATGVPVLAWTLPAGVSAEVRAAGGRGVPDHPAGETDFEVRIARKVQRRAMRAHRRQSEVEHAQLARLDVQGDREWLRWLVLPDRLAHTQGR